MTLTQIYIINDRPAFYKNEQEPLVWSSTGVGSYDIAELSDEIRQSRGSSIVIHLKDEQFDYSDEKKVEEVLKKYSNFVNFPIYLNGNRLNTVNAIWANEPREVTDEQYTEFYKYIANAFDDPLDKLHYRVDVPLDIKALFFIPSFHSEKVSRYAKSYGFGNRPVCFELNFSPSYTLVWNGSYGAKCVTVLS